MKISVSWLQQYVPLQLDIEAPVTMANEPYEVHRHDGFAACNEGVCQVGQFDGAGTELPLGQAAGPGDGRGDGDRRRQRVYAGVDDLAVDRVIEAVELAPRT